MTFIRVAAVTGYVALVGATLTGCGTAQQATPSHHHFLVASPQSPSQNLRHEPFLISLSMTSSTQGWAIGGNGSVLHTTTSGSTWHVVSSTTVQRGIETALKRTRTTLTENPWITVQFFSGTVAWVGVATGDHIKIFRTVDGGQEWQQSVLTALHSTSKIKLSALNGRQAWMMDAVSGQAGSSVITLWKTSDGGSQWQLVTHKPAPDGVSIAFNRKGIGYETGTTPVFNQLVMARSLDGGRGWAPDPWALPQGEFQVTTFTPRFDGATPIVPYLLVNQQTQKEQWRFARGILTTNTWSTLPPLPGGTYHGVTPPLSSFVGNHGWVMGNKTMVRLQHDQWHSVTVPSGNSVALSFVTSQRGWLLQAQANHSTLWMTTNSGNTWKALR